MERRLARLGALLLAVLAAAPAPAQTGPPAVPREHAERLDAELRRLGVDPAASHGGVTVFTPDPLLGPADDPRTALRPDALARDLRATRDALAGVRPLGPLVVLVRDDLAADAAGRVRAAAAAAGFGGAEVRPASTDPGALGPGTVYLDAGTGLAPEARARLLRGLASRGVVVLAASPELVAAGALLAASPPHDERLVRTAALIVRDVQAGRAPERAAVAVPPVRFTLNEATARQLGLSVPWALRLDADVVAAAAGVSGVSSGLALADALRIGADSALAVRAEAFAVRADQQGVALARSRLLPQLVVQSEARVVSDDLGAAALGGANPERLWTAEARAVQGLFDEPAFAGVSVARRGAAARGFQLAAARLDAAAAAGRAFLGLLRVQTGADIERTALARVRRNLDAARVRQQVGTGGPGDVARLDAEAAQARGRLARALGGAEAARAGLNAALGRAPGAPVEALLTAAGDADPLRAARAVVAEALAAAGVGPLPTPESVRDLADAQAARALDAAPEVIAVRLLLAGSERSLTSARRALVLPSLRLQGGIGTRLASGGAGTGPLPPGLPIPPFPRETWQVGVALSLPVLTGGARLAQVRQAEAQLGAAQARLDGVRLGVETRARAAAHGFGAETVAFGEALAAAEAATEAYRIVERLYREGQVTLLDVLDAQTALRISEDAAVQSAYDVAEAALELQRAAASFGALGPDLLTDPTLLLRRP